MKRTEIDLRDVESYELRTGMRLTISDSFRVIDIYSANPHLHDNVFMAILLIVHRYFPQAIKIDREESVVRMELYNV